MRQQCDNILHRIKEKADLKEEEAYKVFRLLFHRSVEIFSKLTLKMLEKQFRKITEFGFPLQSALLGIYVYFMLSAWHPTRILALYVDGVVLPILPA